jgi:hypothetical protein
MHQLRPFNFAVLTTILFLIGFIGCTQQLPKPQDLSDAKVRQLAIKFRDAWLAEGKDEAVSILARSTIGAVERQPQHGWHITFKTTTGHSAATPEGIHDYYLHVYLKPSGDLDRIVRGPDLMS